MGHLSAVGETGTPGVAVECADILWKNTGGEGVSAVTDNAEGAKVWSECIRYSCGPRCKR